ncbi:MAG: polysaccharide biosynthesis tyrosine autokinase [Streptosporangiaceae bacterium]|jgi:capsular exopolysaccharide synthesis family protein
MTPESGSAPTLRSYIALAARRKWWIIGFALLGLAASLALSLTQADQYSSTAQILVQPSGTATATGAPAAVTPTEVQTDLQLVTSAQVELAVGKQLGSKPSISAAEVAQTNVIAITAISSSPSRAALIANAYANAFVTYQQQAAISDLTTVEAQLRTQIKTYGQQISKLKGRADAAAELTALLNQQAVLREQLAQMQVSGAVATGGVELVTPALAPSSPSSPKPREDGVLGLVAGLILGIAFAFLRDSFDDRLSSKDAAEQLSGAPVLAMVPMVSSWKKRDQPLVVSISHPLSPSAEAYRSTRTSLQFIRQERELRTLLVTSPTAAEGKTSTVANLGVVFAQAGERVVLVSCDLRKPRLGKFFGIDEQTGLTSVLLGELSLTQALQQVAGHDGLWLLGAGKKCPNPAELLSGPAARDTFAALRASFDLVLIDSPPVLPVTDAAVLAKDNDGTLIVVAAGQTKRIDLRRAAEKLAQVNASVIGTVLNQVTRQTGYGYGYGHGYGSSYGSAYGYGAAEPSLAAAGIPASANGSAAKSGNGSAPGGAANGSRHGRARPWPQGTSESQQEGSG